VHQIVTSNKVVINKLVLNGKSYLNFNKGARLNYPAERIIRVFDLDD